ncbi:MAG TPA: hypothetical protein VN253_19730 [Kofleriaceae bacterium]|nr:hypothetical protein [Kofleriaceae bacterium]
MTKLSSLGLAILMAFTVAGCDLYFGPADNAPSSGTCLSDGYYVNGEWVSAQCPGGGNECASNDDCAAGCHCAIPDGASQGKCEEAGFCSKDSDCAAGYKCDDRSSCIPDPNPPSCAAPIDPTCTNGAPKCPAGQVPLIQDGCYADINNDGRFDCSAISACAAPPSCSAFQYAADCMAGNACTVVTKGINCTKPGGGACQDGQAGCTCAMYIYDSCR